MKIVVIDTEGIIIGVEPYDNRNDAERNDRRQAAAQKISVRLGISAPMIKNRMVTDELGNQWGIMVTYSDIQVDMVEIGWGVWGFPSIK